MVKRIAHLVNPIRMRGKIKYLLISLIILLLCYPFLENSRFENEALSIFFSFVMLSALYVANIDKKHLAIGMVLGIPAMIANWLNYVSGRFYISHFLSAMFYLYVIYSLLTYLIRAVVVTPNVLYASIVTYLLIGIAFGEAFMTIETLIPGSFSISSPNWPDMIYYSFTALTTVGYGDINALSSFARMVSSIESVSGQMFLTIIVAKLVALSVKNKDI